MKIGKKGSYWFIGALFALLWVFSGSAQAASPYNNCSSGQLPFTTTMVGKVASGLPVGAVIPGSDVNTAVQINCAAGSDADTVGCVGGGGWALTANTFTPATTTIANTYTYPGLNAGVGFQALGQDGKPLPLQSAPANAKFFIINPNRPVDGLQTAYVRYRLIKIAATVTAGTSPTPRFYMACNGAEFANRDEAKSYVNMTATITNVVSTCKMATPDTQVVLPEVKASAFSGVGSAAGRVAFNLNFQCDALALAKVGFTDSRQEGNAGSNLTPAPGASAATGVGVQMLSGGAPVVLTPNELFSVGGTHLALTSGATAQVVSFPLSAEYVQSAAKVTPGTVQSSALVNIVYQ